MYVRIRKSWLILSSSLKVGLGFREMWKMNLDAAQPDFSMYGIIPVYLVGLRFSCSRDFCSVACVFFEPLAGLCAEKYKLRPNQEVSNMRGTKPKMRSCCSLSEIMSRNTSLARIQKRQRFTTNPRTR